MAQPPSNTDVEKKKFYLLFEKNRPQRELGFKPPQDAKTYREIFQTVLKNFASDPGQYISPLEEKLAKNPTKQEIKIATRAIRRAAKKRVPIELKKGGDLFIKGQYHYPPQLGGPIDDGRRKTIVDYFTRIPLTSQNVNAVNQLAYKSYLTGGGFGYYQFEPYTKEEIAHTLDDMDFNTSISPNTDPTTKGWRCSAVQDGVKLPPILKSQFTPSSNRRLNPFMVQGSIRPEVAWEKKREYFKNSRKYCREFKTEQNKRRRLQ